MAVTGPTTARHIGAPRPDTQGERVCGKGLDQRLPPDQIADQWGRCGVRDLPFSRTVPVL